MHVQLSSGLETLIFLSSHLCPYIVSARSEGSDVTNYIGLDMLKFSE